MKKATRYSPEVMERAVRMVFEHRADQLLSTDPLFRPPLTKDSPWPCRKLSTTPAARRRKT
jgi:hypothetical protein